MRVEHISAVSAIERHSFPQPWPQNAYRREIQENRMAHYIIVRQLRLPPREQTTVTAPGQRPAQAGGDLIGRISRFLRPVEPAPSPELEDELRSIVGYAGIWV